jgi:regulator of replication initiation timing
MIVREKLDELIAEIEDIHNQIAKLLDEDVEAYDLNDRLNNACMMQDTAERVKLLQKYAMERMVVYRNLIVCTVDIGVNVARR